MATTVARRSNAPSKMAGLVFELAIMPVAILAELFTNALEHLGDRFKISECVTSSLFAAVGTASPEPLVPLLAIAGGSKDSAVNQEIGVGAILGEPLMLSTLGTFLMTLAILNSRGAGRRVRHLCDDDSPRVESVDPCRGTEAPVTMVISCLGVPTNLATIALQLMLAVALLVWGRKVSCMV